MLPNSLSLARFALLLLACSNCLPALLAQSTDVPLDPKAKAKLIRDVRSLLSNRCFACHGPDESKIEAGLRLDDESSAKSELDSGFRAIVEGDPNASELLRRVMTTDDSERMPPPHFAAGLTESDVALLRTWIAAGAPFARHWSFLAPNTPKLPVAPEELAEWANQPIDHFVLAKMIEHSLSPSPMADRESLLRRVTMDLTGLPPTWSEMEDFSQDQRPDAYERLVDRLLASPGFGEHWGRKWLDLARYADSAGYADDPIRTIWAYRDWVIRAWNRNQSFDEFTRDQLAGDLLPNPTTEQLVATAFHRNTLTNNEGGTNDEEFRNVAVVDRVNTTMAVWMGVTMACAQCHSHKYDPISQQEYFRVFAIFNQSQDADRSDEAPRLDVYTESQQRQRRAWELEAQEIGAQLNQLDPRYDPERREWESLLHRKVTWDQSRPAEVSTSSKASVQIDDDQRIFIPTAADRDGIQLEWSFPAGFEPNSMQAFECLTIPDPRLDGHGAGHGGGNFVVTRVSGEWVPLRSSPLQGRYVRVELTGADKILSLAEVEVWDGGLNRALSGSATQSSVDYDAPAARAIDGNTDGTFIKGSTTHTASGRDPWWEVDLGSLSSIERIVVHNRTDGQVFERLQGAKVIVLDEQRMPLWSTTIEKATTSANEWTIVPQYPIVWDGAFADFEQDGFPARGVLDDKKETGWAVGGRVDQPHRIGLVMQPNRIPDTEPNQGWRLRLRIECESPFNKHLLASFRVRWTADEHAPHLLRTPKDVLEIANIEEKSRTVEQQGLLARHYQSQIAPTLKEARAKHRKLLGQLAEMKAGTSVPIMRDLATAQRRETFVQLRGNYKAHGERVEPGFPTAFHYAKPKDINQQELPPSRFDLARWLMQADNPLTGRVVANRLWESLFGQGLVRTSEEFGSQGDLPTHPELLDYLATEMHRQAWDLKAVLRTLVLSSTYRQRSSVDRRKQELDPENVYLWRGPRFRLSAEEVRDQALAVSGLLSRKMYGEPVRPRQPTSGLSAAFGSKTDWETSMGEDSYRRGLYTAWRRSNPYPSMATFDAPNREVCVLRRDRTNTPLQALVTLNDPVYIEAAQGLARRVVLFEGAGQATDERLRRAFRLVMTRWPGDREVHALQVLLERTKLDFAANPERAIAMATNPLGPLPVDADPLELAAWTVVCNALLNVDEVLMSR